MCDRISKPAMRGWCICLQRFMLHLQLSPAEADAAATEQSCLQALDAVLGLAKLGPAVGAPMPQRLMLAAVDIILSFLNYDGGFATYSQSKTLDFVERLNPTEVFEAVVNDISYVECTGSCLAALASAQRQYPKYRAADIASAMQRGRWYIEKMQRQDGSWYGSWGVCFTYGAWGATRSLRAGGWTLANNAAQRAGVAFLLTKQRADGGWSESYLSTETKIYSEAPGLLLHSHDIPAGTPVACQQLPTEQAHCMARQCPRRHGILGATALSPSTRTLHHRPASLGTHVSVVARVRRTCAPQSLRADGSQAPMTAWAMLALLQAGVHGLAPAINGSSEAHDLHVAGVTALHQGAACLLRLQLPTGDWPAQHTSGASVSSITMMYSTYRNSFPIWALALYRRCILLGEPYC
jgi:squalene cyclase